MNMKRRLDALDKPRAHYTIGELLDALDGVPLPAGKSLSPVMVRSLDQMEDARG